MNVNYEEHREVGDKERKVEDHRSQSESIEVLKEKSVN